MHRNTYYMCSVWYGMIHVSLSRQYHALLYTFWGIAQGRMDYDAQSMLTISRPCETRDAGMVL